VSTNLWINQSYWKFQHIQFDTWNSDKPVEPKCARTLQHRQRPNLIVWNNRLKTVLVENLIQTNNLEDLQVHLKAKLKVSWECWRSSCLLDLDRIGWSQMAKPSKYELCRSHLYLDPKNKSVSAQMKLQHISFILSSFNVGNLSIVEEVLALIERLFSIPKIF